ncbi:MAG: ATP-binding protein [Azonexus sp.]|nr:ATP-binding protein [Azonexus sp.]
MTKRRATIGHSVEMPGATIGHFPGLELAPIVATVPSRQRTPLIQKPRRRGFFLVSDIAVIDSLTQVTQLRLINLRWLSVLAMAIAAIISPSILGSSDLMPRLLALATVIGCANVCLLVAAMLYRGDPEGIPLFSPIVQLTFDLAAWSAYVYLSGGASNPLISILLPLVAIGAIILSNAQAWLIGIAAILAYSFLWKFNQPLAIHDARTATNLHLLGMWLVFAVSTIVVIWFIRQMTNAIRLRDMALAEAREQAIRDDWLISLGALAAGAAHELSTPLATLNVLVDDLLFEDTLAPSLHQDIELMKRQITLCKQALTQLTERAGHSRSAASNLVSAGTWLRRVVAAWHSLNPGAELTIQIADQLTDYGLRPDVAIERAINNLLDNAINADSRAIKVHSELQNGGLCCTIQDEGCGISSAALGAFNQRQPAISSNGMGIGLLLARAAVERLGGSLALRPGDIGGSTACLCLPCQKMEDVADGY